MNPTAEQQKILDTEVQPGSALKIVAYAGTGKTSTFVQYAKRRPNKKLTYLAFNKSVETDAKGKFPDNTLCKTTHALAYSKVGWNYDFLVPGLQSWAIAKALRVNLYEATLISRSLETYLGSADDLMTKEHVWPDELQKLKPGYEDGIIAKAMLLWNKMQENTEAFGMTHSGYLKLYQLSRPAIPCDIILLDEAQDTNPVTLKLVLDQTKQGTSVLMCGDPYQQIYAWRGAIDALDKVEAPTLFLTESFRFGQVVADIANHVLLKIFSEKQPLRGQSSIESKLVDTLTTPYTVITRTNSEIFRQAISACFRGQRFCVVGREQFFTMLDDLEDVFHIFMRQNEKVRSKRLKFYRHFEDLVENATNSLDQELLGKIALVRQYEDSLINYTARVRSSIVADEASADVVFVTCHKAKGLEWDNVLLADDFSELFNPDTGKLKQLGKPTRDSENLIAPDEVNLYYVSATRAKRNLKLNNQLKRLVAYVKPENSSYK